MSGLPPEDAPGGSEVASPRTYITIELLQRAKEGDAHALSHIIERYLPRLQRWARGRLPEHARSLLDTSDLVQEALSRTLSGIERIEVRGRGGFEAYVRQAVLNGVKDQIRRATVRGVPEPVSTGLVTPTPSPLENAIGAELLERYERAMATLDAEDQRLLHLRIELEFDYAEMAAMTGRPSPDAARMAFQRAVGRLAEEMGHERRE
jgi:RNA polymerase sigma-70 factor (ECF subfamily)